MLIFFKDRLLAGPMKSGVTGLAAQINQWISLFFFLLIFAVSEDGKKKWSVQYHNSGMPIFHKSNLPRMCSLNFLWGEISGIPAIAKLGDFPAKDL